MALLPGKAIKLFFSTSHKTLSLRINSVSGYRGWIQLRRRGRFDTHTHKKKALKKWKQRLELFCHKPRDIWNHQKLEEARKDPPLEAAEEARPLPGPASFQISGLQTVKY